MKESKKGRCQKCKQFFYIHDHHILPQAHFGKKGETVSLCPNCHTLIHEYNKKHLKNPDDKNEVEKVFYKWLRTASIIVTCLCIVLWIVSFF